jgi:hypothetical protein
MKPSSFNYNVHIVYSVKVNGLSTNGASMAKCMSTGSSQSFISNKVVLTSVLCGSEH